MLQHFHRWLRSPSSLLYDASLHRMVHKMMKKVWMQLLQRFRKLGSTIVYASFTKLIIYTGKPTVARAMPYCKYVVDTIRQRPLFEWMDIEPALMWECLMYMDSANYGGISYNAEAESEQEDFDLQFNWNLAEYLPQIAQEYFNVIVAEWCSKPFDFRRLQLMEASGDSTQFESGDDKYSNHLTNRPLTRVILP